jgi:threonine dehydrogenase-like Zn-dependent dehydrogenase
MIDEGCAVSVLRSGQDVSVLLGILSTPGQDKAGVVTAAGVVSSRRELKSVIFLIVQLTEDSQTTDGQVQLVFDAAAISIPAIESCVAHARAGAHISFTGVPRADRPDSLSIYVTGITLLQCSSEPEAIKRFVLSTLSANNDNPPAASVCSILSCEPLQLAALQQLASAGSSKAKEFKQAVAKHSRVMV